MLKIAPMRRFIVILSFSCSLSHSIHGSTLRICTSFLPNNFHSILLFFVFHSSEWHFFLSLSFFATPMPNKIHCELFLSLSTITKEKLYWNQIENSHDFSLFFVFLSLARF
jgi:hypothetical protein